MPITELETDPPYPIKQLSFPPDINAGLMALEGGVEPGALPL